MKNNSFSSLDPAVKSIILRHQLRSPVNVTGIAKELGVAVWELKTLPTAISGKIWRDAHGGPSGFSIGVNSREPLSRKRFTVAHEIGHLLLHRRKLDAGIFEEDTMYRGTGMNSTEEIQANQFAADLLMPMGLIHSLMAAGMTGVRDLAAELQVSEPALKIRLGFPIV
jgi:Zn-dependent peptidase ImmA (M78 family)